MWPLELACRARKPVLCCVALEQDAEHADDLLRQVRDSQLPVLMELAPRYLAVLNSMVAQPVDRIQFMLPEELRAEERRSQ